MQHKEDIEVKTPEADGEAAPVDWKLARSLVEPLYLDQKLYTGEPRLAHADGMAEILKGVRNDDELIVAAYLFSVTDCIHDADRWIEKTFGKNVLQLVRDLEQLMHVSQRARSDNRESGAVYQSEALRRMLLAMCHDLRVVVLRLASRLQTLRWFAQSRAPGADEYGRETLALYSPLANRLGIWQMKWELEDLSLRFTEPETYNEISKELDETREQRLAFMRGCVERIQMLLKANGIEAEVSGRPKHIYSIYKKMVRKHLRFDQLFDIRAVRIIVDTVEHCYEVLSLVHENFTVLSKEYDDYIANPKPNGYQSLHTVVTDPNGRPVEIQIRTRAMHEFAELGVAAHWRYKETGNSNKDKGAEAEEQRVAWLRQLLDWKSDVAPPAEPGLEDDHVYALTPQGRVVELQKGATPIDFAYSIHSAIGNSMVGATVNGRIVNFDYVLQNGDIVDIRTSKNAPGPSRDWLNLAKSGAARTKIKQWFKKERREENIVHGKEQFERELRANGIAPADIMGDEILPLILKRLAFTSLDDLYAAIGYGGVTATRTVNRIRDEILRNQKANQKNAIDRINEAAERRSKRARHAVHGILVEGLDNCLIKFSRCCTPVPGDSIIGFITRGAGVSIHRTDCENYLASRDNPETAGRWIRVSWAEHPTDSYSTTLMLLSAQRSGLVMDVATALNTLNAKVRTLTARDVDSGRSTITITVEVHDLAELRTIISRLSAIRGVIRISRSGTSDTAKATANTAELQAEHVKNAKKTKQEGKI